MNGDRIEMPERMENLAKMLTGDVLKETRRCKELMRMPALVRTWSPSDDLAYAVAIAYEILDRSLTSRAHIAKYAGSRHKQVLRGAAMLMRDADRCGTRTAPQEVVLVAAAISVGRARKWKKEKKPARVDEELGQAAPVIAAVQGEEVAARVAADVAKLGRPKGSGADLTEMVFVLDRSGSMASMADSAIRGFNDLVRKQRSLPGRAKVSTVLFDDVQEVLHDHVDLKKVPELTSREYNVRGCTALLDAVGRAISHMVHVQRHTPPARQARHVFFAIITDGYENASREFTAKKVREMVEREQRDYGWEFVFLGANIDAIAAAADIGIVAERAVNFVADDEGAARNFEAVERLASDVRTGIVRESGWRRDVDADYRSRSGRKDR